MCAEILIIAGDFNIHMDNVTDADAKRFVDLLETFGLVQHVAFATHSSGHWLDLIITRSSNDVMVISPRPSLFLSDHCFVECTLMFPSPIVEIKELSFRKWKDINVQALKDDILASTLSELPDGELVSNYDPVLRSILDKHAPLKHKVLVVRPRVPWFNHEFKQLKIKRRKCEKKMRKSNLQRDIASYRKLCNDYCARLHEAKTVHYCNLIEECAGDAKKLFRVVNSICKQDISNNVPPHDCPLQLADDFGQFFCKKIELIKEDIARCAVVPPDVSVPRPEVKLEGFDSVSDVLVRDTILSSTNASCRLDPLPTWLVKKCVDELAPIIAKMINFSLANGCVPDEWKTAHVTPLLKKMGLELVMPNFRPVSNLAFVSKTSERVVIPQLLSHCAEYAPLPTNQSSYRHHHSTETALLKVQNDILLSMDRQEVTLLILLDLSAAFDTIDHNILVELLEMDFGISSLALSWLKSFVSGRKQQIVVDGHLSKTFELTTGVPQGSCLGPILFMLYASRLFHVVKKHLPSVQAFADDTQLYLSFRPDSVASQDQAVQTMENCVSDIRACMSYHQLMLNDSKTEFIIIGSRQQLNKITVNNIHIGSSEIQPVSSVRNLGAWFDSSMTMGVHIGKACSKAFYGLYKIKQIRKYLSEDSTRTLIHAFVTSHVDYCNSLLFGVSKYQLNRLQRVLNAAARITCRVPRYAHITPVLIHLHWLPMTSRVDYKIALLVFKALHGMAPSYLSILLDAKSKTRYSLRNNLRDLLAIPSTKCKTFGDRAFSVAGPRIWNCLPIIIRQAKSIDSFKIALKTHLFKAVYKL